METTELAQHYLLIVYSCYAVTSVALTIWLARVLSSSGGVFLADVFAANSALGDAVNRLLVVGFYLVNLGWALHTMVAPAPSNLTGAVETLAAKLGTLLLCLAAMHFGNLYLFHSVRQRARLADAPPPVLPSLTIGARAA